MLDSYHLESHTKFYSKNSENLSKTFQNVTDLIINIKALTEEQQCYFSRIKSLTLNSTGTDDRIMMTNIHLDITRCNFQRSSNVLFELLKNAPQLSSLNIHTVDLKSFSRDEKLGLYLNKMITKLQVTEPDRSPMDDATNIIEFCRIFVYECFFLSIYLSQNRLVRQIAFKWKDN